MALDAAYTLIFGGCCSNVFALEAIVKHEPDSGLLITVTQFILVALFVLPSQLVYPSATHPQPNGKPSPPVSSNSVQPTRPSTRWTNLRLQRPHLPPTRIATMSLMFFLTNILNNWAFAFRISVPLHIILRSFGSVATLTMGYLHGKRYSTVQVGSVLALTVGVVVAAWADAEMKGKDTSLSTGAKGEKGAAEGAGQGEFLAGLSILFVAQVLGAYMGVYTETTYAKYGRHWREMLFWSHVCGLGFSLFLAPTLWRQLSTLYRTTSSTDSLLPDVVVVIVRPFSDGPIARMWGTVAPPQGIQLLLVNALTQVACISGVNRLSAQTTAVTVTVVLNIRKLVSFLLSCVVFGNQIGGLMMMGAGVVFVSGAVYGWDGSRKKKEVAGEGKKEL